MTDIGNGLDLLRHGIPVFQFELVVFTLGNVLQQAERGLYLTLFIRIDKPYLVNLPDLTIIALNPIFDFVRTLVFS